LQLRTAEEDRAQQQLARTRLDLEQANQRATDAVSAAVAAATDLQRSHAEGSEAWRLAWHRSWIARQRHDVTATQQAAVLSAASVSRATAAVHAARQKRRALERLRDRALQRHQTDVTRHESKEMNLLANLRFLAGEAANAGTHRDD
jgi:flagellar export protein FliJ